MGVEEFINSIENIPINSELILGIEKVYEVKLPEYIGKILSFDANGYFFGDNKRLLSVKEIIDAYEDLHVDFKSMGTIPLFDTGDNDFVLYSFEDNSWKMFNIVDRCEFYQSSDLITLLLM